MAVPVEGVIALSIVAAVGENLLAKGTRGVGIRAMYAAGFWLVHERYWDGRWPGSMRAWRSGSWGL